MSEPSEYLHGYSREEQERLRYQAQILEPYVYDFIDLKSRRKLLEVGCGVGAQTEILLKRFPRLNITGVDISKIQLEAAQKNLAKYLKKNRLEFIQADATKMPVPDKSYDSAFICWFLEHVPDPEKVLKETYSKLKKGAVIYCTEVQNSGVFFDPYCPAVLKYWSEFNDLQWSQKGHPFIGAQLGNLLKSVGFKNIVHDTQTMFFDSRDAKKRKKYVAYFTELLLSAAPQLLKHKRIDETLLSEVKREMLSMADNKNSVAFFPFCRAKAIK